MRRQIPSSALPHVLVTTATIISVALPVGGCSGNAGDAVGTTTQQVSTGKIVVELPHAFGGGTDSTELAPGTEPAQHHALGLEGPLPTSEPDGAEGLSAMDLVETTAQSSIDISGHAPPVGDQGALGDCSSWASGYTSFEWWTNKDRRGGAPFNPVFLYSQLTHDKCNTGTTIEAPMSLLESKGDAPRADYGHTSCATPTKAQMNDAAAHRISGFQSGWPLGAFHVCGSPRFPEECPDSNEQAILRNLASGPIVIGINIYSEFENADPTHYLVGLPHRGSKFFGNHAVTIMKADSKGAWIENQWGTWWGKGGWAELTWDFINSGHTFDAAQIQGLR